MTPLYAHLNDWRGKPFVWGETDCACFIASWVARSGYADPMAADRWTYTCEGECTRTTGYRRDPVGVVGARLAAVGVARGNELRAGDVGVVEISGRPVCAIFGGPWWAVKGPDGVTTLAPRLVRMLAFWSVGYDA